MSHPHMLETIKKEESVDSLTKIGKGSSEESSEDSLSKFKPSLAASSSSLDKSNSSVGTLTTDSLDRIRPVANNIATNITETIKPMLFASGDDLEINIPAEELKNITFCDLHNVPRSEITKNEISFLRKIMKKASDLRDEKIKIARTLNQRHNILGNVARMLSTLTGAAGLGSLLSLSMSNPAFPILFTLSFITLCSALSSNLQSELGYSEKAQDKKKTSDSYNSIVLKVAQFLSTPGTDRKDVEVFTNSISLEMNVVGSGENL